MICKFCNKLNKNLNSLTQHEIRCIKNPNCIKIKKVNWTDEMKLSLSQKMKGKITRKTAITESEKNNSSKRCKNIIWDKSKRDSHSKIMKEAVLQNPNSYSAGNVNGRTKRTFHTDSFGKQIQLNGSWEVIVANYLTNKNIKWTRVINGFEYFWENKIHLYYPDFFLPELNKYIEVKGFVRDRDKAKWNALPELIIIKRDEINKILRKENLVLI